MVHCGIWDWCIVGFVHRVSMEETYRVNETVLHKVVENIMKWLVLYYLFASYISLPISLVMR